MMPYYREYNSSRAKNSSHFELGKFYLYKYINIFRMKFITLYEHAPWSTCTNWPFARKLSDISPARVTPVSSPPEHFSGHPSS